MMATTVIGVEKRFLQLSLIIVQKNITEYFGRFQQRGEGKL